jgi:hypothetical protein
MPQNAVHSHARSASTIATSPPSPAMLPTPVSLAVQASGDSAAAMAKLATLASMRTAAPRTSTHTRAPPARRLDLLADTSLPDSELELQHLADKLDLSIHVSHFPPGTSKWNKIEHRMFSFITTVGVVTTLAGAAGAVYRLRDAEARGRSDPRQ